MYLRYISDFLVLQLFNIFINMMKRIKILFPDEFLALFRNHISEKGTATMIYDESAKLVAQYADKIKAADQKIPINTKINALRNNFKKHKSITFADLTEILVFITEPSKSIIETNDLDHTIKTLQKIFTHLDKNDLKNHKDEKLLRERYNTLLKILTSENHRFGLVQLDSDWQLTGNKVLTKSEVKDYLISFKEKDRKDNSPGEKLNQKKLKSNRIFLISLGVLIIAFIGYKIIDGHNKRIQFEDNIKIVELSKKTEQIRNDELTELYGLIYDELISDYLKDNKRNLSDILIAKIITMSEKFTPYLYDVDSKIINKPLSKERAQLFVSLVRYNLDLDTYNEIFKSANFTSSDFSYMDLSNLNFSKDLYGLYGNYKKEVIGLITISERANLSNSYFYKTNLDNTTIVGILNGCEFEEVNFHETNFNWVELKGSIFENNTLDHVLFNNSNLEGSNFRNTINVGENKGFVYSNLRGVNFDNSSFSGAGYDPFVFKNCFLSTKDIFFEYDLHASKTAIGFKGNPYIEESPLWSKDIYYAYRNIEYNSNKQVTLEVIDSTFKFIGNQKQEDVFLTTLNTDNSYSKFNYYKVRINDNNNRSSKSFEHLLSFDTIRFGVENLKGDTLKIISSLNEIEYRYRDYIAYLNPLETTEEKTTFKDCSFDFTSFKDSSMEFVSFSGAVFKNPKNTIKNNFINCSFHLNDFRIKDGLFFIDNLSSLDSIIVNSKFPALVFKKQISTINTQDYRDYKIRKSNDSLLYDIFYDQIGMKIQWAEYVNRKMVLDTFEKNNQEAVILRKSF